MRLGAASLREKIRSFAPHCVLCTHFLPAAVAADMGLHGQHKARVAVVITDFESHPIWQHPGVHRFFVATPRLADGPARGRSPPCAHAGYRDSHR